MSCDAPAFDVDVRVKRGDRVVGAAFRVGAGLTVLVGASGAGKTSVLHMIAGLLRPDEGRVTIAGETLFDSHGGIDRPPHRRGAGYVFQEPRLFPHRSVRANLRFGARGADVMSTARQLDIADLLDRWPRSLSGGEARRVAIARVLLSRPRFLLLDEPLSSLDPVRREAATRLIERVRDETRLPILMVTHDSMEAERLGHRTVRL
jgi:molybdate transport system ATP-binding protein